MTVCNMSIEAGAQAGMIAPDDTTIAFLEARRPIADPVLWARACEDWRALRSDDYARYDAELQVNAASLQPMVTWGTSRDDGSRDVGVEGADTATAWPAGEPCS